MVSLQVKEILKIKDRREDFYLGVADQKQIQAIDEKSISIDLKIPPMPI